MIVQDMKYQPNGSQDRAISAWWAAQDEKQYENWDNERFAIRGNAMEELAYRQAKARGCCHELDLELKCDDGTVLLYGFNYGH